MAGAVFGMFLDLVLTLSAVELSVVVLIVLPVITGVAATLLGDKFWHWLLKYWWLWSP